MPSLRSQKSEELDTFMVVDGQEGNNGPSVLKERCGSILEKIKDAPSYLTKEKAKEAFRYFAYPRGSPLFTEIKQNLKSGITVSLVSVPLSISLAIAGGGTPVSGVVTAFWAGLVGSLIGGSHYNIVGPTGALSGVLAASAIKFGVQVLPILAIVAGLMCFLVWLFRFDKYVMFIPSSVIHGFTVGVAFIIALNQLNSALGLNGVPHHDSFLENIWESILHVGGTNLYSLGFFAINLAALIVLGKKLPKIPWAIIIAAFGILIGFLTSKAYIPIELQTLEARYGSIDFEIVSIPKFDSRIVSFEIITTSVGVAFIAILETLISARIADGMTKSEHDQQKEVLSIALANILCGAMGGIPATAALARTALNIKTNATSRISGVINSFSVLFLSLVFLPLFKFIPMSTIAALLVMTAIRMVAAEHVIHMYKYDRVMFWISILSAAVCVAIDTMAGILIGGVVSLLLFTDQMSVGHTEMQLNKGKRAISRLNLEEFDKEETKRAKKRQVLKRRSGSNVDLLESVSITISSTPLGVPQTEEFGDTLVYRITGQLTYVNSIAHIHRIKKFAKTKGLKHVIISLRYLWYADLDGVDSLEEMVEVLEAHGIQVYFAGVIHEIVVKTLSKHPFYREKVNSSSIFTSYLDALNHIAETDQALEELQVEATVLDKEERDNVTSD